MYKKRIIIKNKSFVSFIIEYKAAVGVLKNETDIN